MVELDDETDESHGMEVHTSGMGMRLFLAEYTELSTFSYSLMKGNV